MKFSEVKNGQFFYFEDNLFVKNIDIRNQTVPVGSLPRDAVYMTYDIGYPCCIGDDANVILADVEIKHKPAKTFKDIKIGEEFKLDGYTFIKLSNSPGKSVRSPSIEFISDDVIVQ